MRDEEKQIVAGHVSHDANITRFCFISICFPRNFFPGLCTFHGTDHATSKTERQALQKVIKIVSKKHLLRDFHHPVLQFLVFLDIVIV